MIVPFADISLYVYSLLGVLLLFEYLRVSPLLLLSAKAPLSLLFCYVGFSAFSIPGGTQVFFAYRACIMAGLFFGFAGDIALAFIHYDLVFLLGLVLFLIGHVMYAYAFAFLYISSAGSFLSSTPLNYAIAMAVVSLFIYIGLRGYFGDLKFPCLAYIIVITIMVVCANYLYFDNTYKLEGRELALVGAILFFISDLFVACEKFVVRSFVNRMFNLPTYYAAQFLIAYSVASLFPH